MNPRSRRRRVLDRLLKAAVILAAVAGFTAVLAQIPLVRELGAEGLGHTGPWAVPLLCRGMSDEDSRVRQAATTSALGLGPGVQPKLAEGLEDPDPEVRLRYVRATALLAAQGMQLHDLAGRLAELTSDPDPRIREQVLAAAIPLGAAGGPLARVPIPLLDDPDPAVRAKACDAAWRLHLGDPDTMRKLRALQADTDFYVRAGAAEAVEHLEMMAVRK